MEVEKLILFIIIGGLIGWLTNKIAIKMLFRPINPHNFLGIKIQGVFPKRKDQIAISLAEIIEQELLSKEAMLDQLLNEEHMEVIKDKMKKVIIDKLSEAIPPAIAMFMGGEIKPFIEKYMDKHSDDIFNQMIEEFKHASFDHLDIYLMVKERIDELDFIEFEKIIFGLMNKELRFVEIVGLFLGAFIGVIQFVITLFI